MRSKTFFFNITIFRKNVTHFWPVWALYTLVCVCLLPVSTYFKLHNISSGVMEGKEEPYRRLLSAMEGVQISANTWIVFAFAIVSAVAVFSYLYTSRSSNMMHALPLRREELFVTNYLSGLIFLMIPQILSFLITIFLWFGNGITQLEYLLQWLGMVAGETFFAYSLSVFCVMLTGHIVAVPIYFFLLNYLYVGIFDMINMVLKMMVYGYTGEFGNAAGEWLAPLYFFSRNVGVRYPDAGNSAQPWIEGLGYVGCYVPAALILAVLALIMYRRRRLECTGDAIAIFWMKPLLRWSGAVLGAGVCTAFIMTSFFKEKSMSGEAFPIVLLFWMVAGILAFYGIEMLNEKKFMVFGWKRIMESGIFAVLILLFLTGIKWDVLGLENRAPDAEEIAAVYIQGNYERYLTGVDKIEESLKLQREIVASKNQYQDYFKKYLNQESCLYMTVNITYILKNGAQQQRSFDLPLDDFYLEAANSPVKKILDFQDDPEGYMSYYFTNEYSNIRILNGSTIDYVDKDYNFQSQDISTEAAEQLVKALEKDIESGAYQIYPYNMKGREDKTYVNTMMICYMPVKGSRILQYGQGIDSISDGKYSEYASVILTRDCTNTIALLKELGYIDDKNGLVTEKEYNMAMEDKPID